MRVLITGITGYIGSNLARALVGKHQVFGLVREPVTQVYIADLTSDITFFTYHGNYQDIAHAVLESQPDVIYHLAAYYTSAHGPEQTPRLLASNVVLGGYLLEAMSTANIKNLVYASTITEYGQDGVYAPGSLYAASKRAFQDLAVYYAKAENLHVINLILSDTYGPGDYRPKVLNLLKKALSSGERMILSPGSQDYDLVYIDDVINAFILAGYRLYNHLEIEPTCYQIFARSPLSLRSTAEQLMEISGIKDTSNIVFGGISSPNSTPTKALRIYPSIPGWKEKVSLQEGLSRFWHESGFKQEVENTI